MGRETIGAMTRERIIAGEFQTRRPPFLFRTRGGVLFELSKDPLPVRLPWEKLPLMKRAISLFESGIISPPDFLAVKRWHMAPHRRLARWLVHHLQRFC